MDKFVRIGNELYNTKYIKKIKCDKNMCSILIVNTSMCMPSNSESSYYEREIYTKERNNQEYDDILKLTCKSGLPIR